MDDVNEAAQLGAMVVMTPEPEQEAMPGNRAELPAGGLPTTYFGVQGDEHRDPPANAPVAVIAAMVMHSER